MIKVSNIIRHPRGPRLVLVEPVGEIWFVWRSWVRSEGPGRFVFEDYDDAIAAAAEECARAGARPDPRDLHRDDIWLALSHLEPEMPGGAA
jgi:hypothetical protein